MSSDDEPLKVAVILVVLAIQWPVLILEVQSVSKLAHHFCISLSACKCILLLESDSCM